MSWFVLPHGVPRECGDLGHARIPPDDDLVEGVAVGAHDLVDVHRPHEVAHLYVRHCTSVIGARRLATVPQRGERERKGKAEDEWGLEEPNNTMRCCFPSVVTCRSKPSRRQKAFTENTSSQPVPRRLSTQNRGCLPTLQTTAVSQCRGGSLHETGAFRCCALCISPGSQCQRS